MGRGMGKEKGEWKDRRWLRKCESTFNQVKVWVEERGKGRNWNMVRVSMGKGEVTQ